MEYVTEYQYDESFQLSVFGGIKMFFKLKKEINYVLYQRRALLILVDIICVVLSSFLALFIRQEANTDLWLWNNYMSIWVVDVIISLLFFIFFKLYRSLWLFASIVELKNIVLAIIGADITKYLIINHVLDVRLPYSWYFIEPALLVLLIGGNRFLYRYIRDYRIRKTQQNKNTGSKISKVMIVGAGRAGNVLLREIKNNVNLNKRVVCMIDDNRAKFGTLMNGVPIVGNRDTIADNVNKYDIDEIIIALPRATAMQRKEIIDICKETKCKLKVVPGVYQLIDGEVKVSKLREVEIDDLLGRNPIKVDIKQIASYVKDQVVMVTGGGGSIGSELCLQIAKQNPKQLIIIDIYENNAYQIQKELESLYPELNLIVRIASIRDFNKMKLIFDEFRPEIIYHAAAHKHVPLMEDSPNEAVKNNVFGTLNIVKLADQYHVKHFVQISTDKAVNPTNIMGATKRICEMLIQAYDCHSKTVYTAVRFGNVLGSNGSVIPLFKKQIARGGPVTVTSPDIIRYFMTIPEAVSLVLQAGVYAKGGEIFILDMGEPVKIDDLARNLIKLSGFTPDVEIPIVYTGLRPGEKLYEELLMNEEGLKKTTNGSIFVGKPIDFNEQAFFDQLEELKIHSQNEDPAIKQCVASIVKTYHPSNV